jgi:hypothetical protein
MGKLVFMNERFGGSWGGIIFINNHDFAKD